MRKDKESNKLIAEFMGNKPIFEDRKQYQMVTHNNMCYGIKELLYHTSWDWLMPVITKAVSMDEWEYKYPHNEVFWDYFKTLNIAIMYDEVIKYIEWYNKNKLL